MAQTPPEFLNMNPHAALRLAHVSSRDPRHTSAKALVAWEDLLLEIVGERPRADNVRKIRA